MSTTLGVCNLCEAICGLELTVEGDGPSARVTAVRGNPADPLSRGYICPKGVSLADVHADPDRLRTPVRRVGTGADAEWVEISLGRGPRPRRRRAGPRGQRARPRLRRRLPRQPQRPLARLGHPRPGHGEDAAHAQPLQRLVGRPDPPPARRLAALRPPAAAADPRHRPHVLLPGVRRQPDGVQRLADDRARLPQPAARAEGPRRADGRRRSPAHRDGQGGRRAPLRPSGLRRRGGPGDGAHAVRGGTHPPSAVRRPGRPRARAGRAVHPRGRRAGQRHRRGRRTPAGPRAGRGRRRRGVRPDRRLDDRLRVARAVGHPVPQHPDRPLRPAGRRAVHRAGHRLRGAAVRRHRPLRPVAQPRARRSRSTAASCRPR